VKQLYSFFHWTLESLATSDQSRTTSTFVNHSSANASRKVVTKFMARARHGSLQSNAILWGACVLGEGRDNPCCHGQIAPRFYPWRTRKIVLRQLAARNKTSISALLDLSMGSLSPTCALGALTLKTSSL